MSYETEEQQLEALKEWWKENGTPLIIGAILGLAGFAGWKYWSEQQVVYQASASDLYTQVIEITKSDDKKDLVKSAQAIKNEYPKSSYSILSAFQLAKLAVEANEFDKAIVELTWVVDNHPSNELTEIAKIRLARLFIHQQQAEQALGLLSAEETSGYYALANLVKGDALMLLERKDEALQAYKIASNDLAIGARHPSLKLKINQLSAVTPVIPAIKAAE